MIFRPRERFLEGQNKSGDEFGLMHKTSVHFRYQFFELFWEKTFFLDKGLSKLHFGPIRQRRQNGTLEGGKKLLKIRFCRQRMLFSEYLRYRSHGTSVLVPKTYSNACGGRNTSYAQGGFSAPFSSKTRFVAFVLGRTMHRGEQSLSPK